MPAPIPVAVIGGGPAGLRAAEVAASAGLRVTVFDAKPSVGRKFLVAGKGGLNLTHGEEIGRFASRYHGPDLPPAAPMAWLAGFGPREMRAWAESLGVETFQASSGRVYPKALKAAPLLRRWISRLKALGVRFEMNHRWSGLEPGNPHRLEFSNGTSASAEAVVFAMGGGSWPQTGSTGAWVPGFESLGVPCSPLAAANCGWETTWTDALLAACEGKPMKNIVASAGGTEAAGELLVTRYGLEGGVIYQLTPALRSMREPVLVIDLKPTFSHDRLVAKMESVRRNHLQEACVRWRLGDAARAVLSRCQWSDTASLARAAKHCVIPLIGPRPIEEAISSAGGVRWGGVDNTLMLSKYPGVFVAGEMLDWEAPTGGYLVQGCFATGSLAGRSAAAWIAARCE